MSRLHGCTKAEIACLRSVANGHGVDGSRRLTVSGLLGRWYLRFDAVPGPYLLTALGADVLRRASMSEVDQYSETLDALNRLPYAQFLRNDTGVYRAADGTTRPKGLGKGSPDFIGQVTLDFSHFGVVSRTPPVGRFCALEFKREGARTDVKRAALQAAWARGCRAHGGFCATVRSVAEALSAVERCRRGESE